MPLGARASLPPASAGARKAIATWSETGRLGTLIAEGALQKIQLERFRVSLGVVTPCRRGTQQSTACRRQARIRDGWIVCIQHTFEVAHFLADFAVRPRGARIAPQRERLPTLAHPSFERLWKTKAGVLRGFIERALGRHRRIYVEDNLGGVVDLLDAADERQRVCEIGVRIRRVADHE